MKGLLAIGGFFLILMKECRGKGFLGFSDLDTMILRGAVVWRQ